MQLSQIIPHIEALIFASDKPLTRTDIVELINNTFGFMEERVSHEQIEICIEGIREKYTADFYPFEIKESGGGWQFLTKKEYHKTVAQLTGDKFLKRLSNAALETLAIIAYKQPITKGEVEAIRGVNSDYSIQKLLEKELIIITGRNEELPGKPLIYSTSKSFMDYFGINSTDDLPKIKEILAEQSIQGTLLNDASNPNPDIEKETPARNNGQVNQLQPVAPEESHTTLIVGDNGELIEQSNDVKDKDLPEQEVSGATTTNKETESGDNNNSSSSSNQVKDEE